VRILTDQDVYVTTLRLIRDLGHDVVAVADVGMERATDEQLLTFSQKEKRCFVTRDRDFGPLAISQRQGGGIIYLRMTPSTVSAVHAELTRVLERHTEKELLRAFVVVEPVRHRFLVWLKASLATATLPINTTRGHVHCVNEGLLLLVSPAIFKDLRQPKTSSGPMSRSAYRS